jgi:Zn-dependent protease with chaperone function/uncharacterized tellurite resistance protein B-like protein
MNFFEHQERARKKTGQLLLLFLFAVAGIIAALYLVFSLGLYRTIAFDPALLGMVGIGTGSLIFLGSAGRMASLAAGGASVAASLGGTPISTATRDPKERRLLNIVQEMAIASGVPVPEVYLLQDPSINAFAAGQSPTNSVIGVTQGTMNLLSRDELQGVIAHEFSHILNGDSRLNMRLMGLLHGILLLSILGRLLLNSQRTVVVMSSDEDRRGSSGAALMMIGIGVYLVGSIGVFFASLIKSAVSRQREFLADASAVQFTRNPEGIAGALKKIGGLVFGSKIQSPSADEASHIFFSNALSGSMLQLFETHPPLDVRIKAIDPSFDGDFSKFAIDEPSEIQAFRSPLPEDSGAVAHFAGDGPPSIQPPTLPQQVPDTAGDLTKPGISYASESRVSWPDELHRASEELFSAAAATVALVISGDPNIRSAQLDIASQVFGKGFAGTADHLNKVAEALPVSQRLPFVDSLVPVLKAMSHQQASAFAGCLGRIVESDGQISLFEYTLQHIVLRQLGLQFGERRGGVRYNKLREILPDAIVLLSALAAVNATNEQALNSAFAAGAVDLAPNLHPAPADLRSLSNVDDALDRLALAAPPLKRQIVLAASKVVFADREVTVSESELLRAISESLDCPIPPFVANAL